MNSRATATWIAGFLLFNVLASTSHAAPPPGPLVLPSAQPLLNERIGQLETQIAALALQRPDVSGMHQTFLDVKVDFRVLCRWMLVRSLAAEPASELQVDAYIRGMTLAAATAELESYLESLGDQPQLSDSQRKAMQTLNTLSYELPEIKTAADLDRISSIVGQLLLQITTASLNDIKAPPLMRPSSQSQDVALPIPTDGSNPNAGPKVEQLAAEIRTLSIAEPLRKQLLEMANRINMLASAKGQENESKALTDMLIVGTEMARGLQSRTALLPETRDEMAKHLAEGLALFLDPRMRSAGKARLDALEEYRQTLSRIGRLRITPELAKQLAPAFIFAQSDPEEGHNVMGMIERYIELSIRDNERTKPENLQPAYTNALAALETDFQQHQTDFIADAGNLGGDNMTATDPKQLAAHVAEMSRELELMETIGDLTQLLDVLAAYKPKPTGGLEKRMALALTAASSTKPSADRDTASALLQDIRRLCRSADEIANRRRDSIPAEVATAYAGNQLDKFDAKWKELIVDLANNLAGGAPVDHVKLERLSTASQMHDALSGAATLESSLKRASALNRWADWSISAGQLSKTLTPYREALARAFEGFVKDDNEAIQRFARVRPRFEPLILWINNRAVSYGDACNKFPTGLSAKAGQLMTPMAGAPFELERYASFALAIWARYERKSDYNNADAAANALALQLQTRIRQ